MLPDDLSLRTPGQIGISVVESTHVIAEGFDMDILGHALAFVGYCWVLACLVAFGGEERRVRLAMGYAILLLAAGCLLGHHALEGGAPKAALPGSELPTTLDGTNPLKSVASLRQCIIVAG